MIGDFLLLRLDLWIELLEGSTIEIIYEDDLSEAVQFLADTHMVNQRLPPVREFSLCEAQARAS